jgi:DNA (cytosine-5)-methyltransferase 1
MRLDPEKDTTKFRRMSWSKPALTLRGGEAFYHPFENRYLTPREYMRLHGFPDSHMLFGPIRARTGTVRDLDQHRLVANAVPPSLAHAVGAQIKRFIS